MSRQQNRFSFVFALCAVLAVSAASAVEVSNGPELEAAVAAKTQEIVLNPGDYKLTGTLVISKENGTPRIVGKSANPRDTVIYGDGTFRIIDLSTNKAYPSFFANFTVSNGYTKASGGSSSSAGVWGYSSASRDSYPTLSNLVVTCNTIDANGNNTGHGAGVSFCKLYDCKVTRNKILTAQGNGAAVHYCDCYDTEISDNETAGSGGGVGASSSAHRCRIFSNLAKKSGGGVFGNSNSTTIYDGTIVSNNTAYTYGAGIHQVTAYDSEICMNILNPPTKQGAEAGAGVADCALVSNCVIRGNALSGSADSGTRLGGGSFKTTLRHCRVYDNFSEGNAAGMNMGVAYDCIFSNNCNSGSSYGNYRTIEAECCVFYGAAIDYTCRLVNCQFLNFGAGGDFSYHMPAGANVLAEGDYTVPSFVIKTGKTGETIAVTNCLFANNWFNGGTIVVKTNADKLDLVNCTFVDNHCKWTMTDRSSSQEPNVPINVINCAFPRNFDADVINNHPCSIRIEDGARNIVFKNCLFGPNKVMTDVTLLTPEENCVNDVADMKFDTTNAEHPYSLKRKSPAIGKGLYQDWMASATDLKGDPRAHEDDTVAIGCYECWIPASGLMLLLR